MLDTTSIIFYSLFVMLYEIFLFESKKAPFFNGAF